MGWWHDDADLSGREEDRDCGCGGDSSRHDDWHDHGRHHHHRRHRCEIPIGDITVDCTPVTFRTPGQAFNLVSCPKSFQVPGPGGVPCVATVNNPPLQIPVQSTDHRKKCGCA